MADVVEFLKVLAPVVSILVATSAILQTLERARRELAVSLIYNWANHTDWVTNRAVTMAKELPPQVIDKINEKDAVSIPNAYYEGIVSILRTGFPEDDLPVLSGGRSRSRSGTGSSDTEGEFQISKEQSEFIKFQWVRWLNRLEGTLAAWQQGAADVHLMQVEFAPLVRGRAAELEVLEKVRAGLPIIEAFYQLQRKTGSMEIRPRLGIFPWRR